MHLWHPTEAVDDTTLIPLDPSLTVEGMREEIRNMTKCCVGRVVSSHDVELAKKSKQEFCQRTRILESDTVL